MQTITSEKTALRQLPALHKSETVVNAIKAYVQQGKYPLILDYGAGKSAELAKNWFAPIGGSYTAYDPYNIPGSSTALAIMDYDIVLCSNVLNVINDIDAMRHAIRNILFHLAHDGTAFFKVYEGNKSCIGQRTAKGWQQNKPTEYYYWKIYEEAQNFHNVSVKKHGKIIIVSRTDD